MIFDQNIDCFVQKKTRLIGFIEKMDQNLWIYPKNSPFLPKIYSIYAKLLCVQSLDCQTAKNSGEPQKMTHSLETEIFFRVVQMGKL